MSSRAFRVLIVADDRKTLRRLSRFLNVFGFQVESVADGRQARSVYEANPPDFLIVDGDTPALQHCRPLLSDHRSGYTYTFLLVRDMTVDGLTEALRAGVDDFLAKPIVYGELLARLRSGARVLEYERRMREQSAVDCITSLLSRSAFRDRVQSELEHDDDPGVACVVIDLDFFENINRIHGHSVGDEAIRTVAEQIKTKASECKYLASFGSGRFAAMLPDPSDARALAWAEQLREAIAGLEITLETEPISLTASLGVAGSEQGADAADDLIARAEQAVQTAKASGRNCVARCGQFDSETREWEDLARQGRLFENTVARDVMVPAPRFAHEDDDLRDAAELLAHTRLTKVPVIDQHGKLVGLFSEDLLPRDIQRTSGWRVRVGDVMVRDISTVPEDAGFNRLMDFFTSETSANYAIVVRQNKPLGIVYRSSLAALSEPLMTDSFAPDKPYSTSSDYLLVPDTWTAE